MKPLRLLLLVALFLLGWFAWSRLPGLRTSVGSKIDEYGGWTDEARADDPVGFLDYAEEKLGRDIETFHASRATLETTRADAANEKARNETLHAAASELVERFRAAYRAAAGAWPIELGGASYGESEFLEQVESLLGERDTYARVVTIYTDVIAAAEEQRKQLRSRIQTTEATLVEVRAQRELVRVQKATEETDELLAQIDSLLTGNDDARGELQDPVRSVEDLLAATEEPARSSALDFLRE